MSKQELLNSGRLPLSESKVGSLFKIRPQLAQNLVLGTLFVLILTFILFPLAKVFWVSIVNDGSITLEHYQKFFTDAFNFQPFLNSISLATSVALVGTFVGYVLAYTVVRTKLAGRKILRIFGIFPMISPPFVISLAAIILLGQNGVITRNILVPVFGLEGFSIYGFKGLLLVETMSYFPTAFLIFCGVFATIDPVLQEAAYNQGATPWQAFRDVLFPLTKPGIYSSLLLIFIESIADFANPLVLSGSYKVLSVEAYLKITGEYNLPMGATVSTVLLIPALIAFFIQRYYVEKKSFVTLTGKASSTRLSKKHPTVVNFILGFFACVVCTVIATLYGAVIWGAFVKVWGADHSFTLNNFLTGIENSIDYMKDTFLLAFIATPITGILALIISYLLVRKNFAGKAFLDVSSMLTFAVPGTVVGIGYILAFNSEPLILTGTSMIIVTLLVFRNMPVGIRSTVAALKQLDPALEEASQNLGANTIQTVKNITAPLLAPAVFSGLAYSFVRCLTAISAVIFVVSGSWNLLTVSLLGQIELGHLSMACAICLMLIVFAGSVLALMQYFVFRKGLKR